MKCKIIYVIAAICFVLKGNTQNITNTGMEFWVGYGHHQYMEPANCDGSGTVTNTMNMILYLSAEEATQVEVTLDSSATGPFIGSGYKRTYSIPANTVISTEIIPKGDIDAPYPSVSNYDARLIGSAPPAGSGGEQHFRRKGIYIKSLGKPIVAYAHIYGTVASGATMLLPVTAWGYNYTAMNSEQRDASRSYSWMYVIAKENNTKVVITPSVPTRLGKQQGVPFEVELEKGQIYQLVGQSDCATGNGVELTGTTVKSIAGRDGECHAIAMFCGSGRTAGEETECGRGSGRDNDMQQMFPEQAWGKRYLTAPFSTSNNASRFMTSVYKVLVRDPTTVVIRNGVQLTGLQKNKYYIFKSNTADSIIADKPIMVGQFMSMGSACKNGSTDGDPEMVYLSPLEQAIKRVGFFRNNKEVIKVNYLTLIVPTAGLSSLRIDGSYTFTHTYPHSMPGYTVVIRSWTSEHAQGIVTCDYPFTGVTYGMGGAESYAYNAGTYINNLNGIPDIRNISDTTNQGQNSHPFTCNNSPAELSILVRYQATKIVWKISDLGLNILPNLDVEMNPITGYYKGTVVKNGILYHKYTLPGTYTFTQPGDYYVRVLCTSPSLTEHCNNTEEFYLGFEVKPMPTANFTFSNSTNCVRDVTKFTGPDETAISKAQQWAWTFPDGSTSDKKEVDKVLSSTTGEVVLRAISAEGCIAKSTRQVNLLPPPTASVTVSVAETCQGNSIVFTPSASFSGSAPVNRYYWQLLSGATVTTATPDPQTVLFERAGDTLIRMTAGVSEKCMSDTFNRTVKIYSKPVVDIEYSRGCLPADGIVVFTNKTTTTDAQSITGHSWEFGDPSSGTDNKSVLESPSHTYSSVGNYDITYKATSSKGCVTDTLIKATFNISPAIDFPATLAPVCEKDAPFSIAVATVTNGMSGTFAYSGPGVNASGEFNPATAGPGEHDIIASYTSTANCVVTKTARVKVNASPVAAFSLPGGGCLPVGGEVKFDNTSSSVSGETLTWLWNFNDPNAAAGNENTSTAFEPSHKFTNGTYNISLKAIAPSGCSAEAVNSVVMNVMPVVDYPPIAAVCESAPSYSIATATVNGAVITGGVYGGRGVSPTGNFDPSAAGTGTHEITYTYTSAGGCTAEDKSTVRVMARPLASFSVSKKDICLGEKITITPASQSGLTWRWTFGDGSSRTINNNNSFDAPAAGTAVPYKIELVTENSLGCVSTKTTETISIHPLPLANFTVPTKICVPGTASFINSSAVADNSSLTYVWTFSDAPAVVVTDKDPVRNYSGAGTYYATLTATSAFGCKDVSDTKPVSDFYTRPNASFNILPAEICQGQNVIFTDASTPASSVAERKWTFSDGGNYTGASVTRKFDNAGQFTASVTVTNAAGCDATSIPKTVTVYPQPVIDAGRSFTVLAGTQIQFEATANTPSLSFRWSPAASLSNATTLRPSLVVTQDAVYTLTATGGHNCSASDNLTVSVLKTVVIPNAFSPNNDRVNDVWDVPNLSDYRNALVQVFNRYGQKVFETKGYSKPWDGKSNGTDLPMGTYYYVINLGDGSAPMTGGVTIIR